tara:strand:- start:419 stop:832 length:414 start_codon:yes stop_codon:yes gene_type:complete
MRKTISVVTMVSLLNVGMHAQAAPTEVLQTEQIELSYGVDGADYLPENLKDRIEEQQDLSEKEPTEAELKEVEEKPLEVGANESLQTKAEMQKKKKKKKKKDSKEMSLGAQIGIAIAAVGIIVLFIVTGGEGLSSRG